MARAAYFPSIALTGGGGLQSTALGALFGAGAGVLDGGRRRRRSRSSPPAARARRWRWPRRAPQEATLSTRRRSRQAFREASDALVGYAKAREFREQQERLTTAAQDARRLADIRYQGGATSYLEVLDADTRLFDAEIGLAEARLSELSAFVELYRALGGGWQQEGRAGVGRASTTLRPTARRATLLRACRCFLLAGAGSSGRSWATILVSILHTLGNTLSPPAAGRGVYRRSSRRCAATSIPLGLGMVPSMWDINQSLVFTMSICLAAMGLLGIAAGHVARCDAAAPAARGGGADARVGGADRRSTSCYQITPALVSMAVVTVLYEDGAPVAASVASALQAEQPSAPPRADS